MKRTDIPFLLTIAAMMLYVSGSDAMAFGRRNHATVAYIAEQHLTKKAHRQINEICKGETLAEHSVLPDENSDKILVELLEGEYIMQDGMSVLKGYD